MQEAVCCYCNCGELMDRDYNGEKRCPVCDLPSPIQQDEGDRWIFDEEDEGCNAEDDTVDFPM
jgi:hypothetical protein